MNNFLRALADAAREKTEERKRDEIISKLLDSARSLTNEDELEMFQDYLQEALDNENRQKAAAEDRIDSALMQLDGLFYHEMLKILPMNSLTVELQEMISTAMRVFKKAKSYLQTKKKGFAQKGEDTEKKLKDSLKQDVHSDL
ncbi:unnamed protein product [Menidia menidia]|uniref:(Atlantic silverside) hypothetical protein n=1 Tax=Menidia menidia TaxID=238744 RepID=A0A8S4B4I5_9TELE|nr:unnamed protein product [Menidia menidia]